MPSVLDSRVDESWRQQRCTERTGTLGFLLHLPDLMMASTCCFMVPAGVTQLPFAQNTHFLSSFSPCLLLLFHLILVCLSYFPFIHSGPSSPASPFSHHLPPHSTPSFLLSGRSLWLIALMLFLWSTAMSCSSELVWPHVLQKGMNRRAGEGPGGVQAAKYQNNMSHSCLITSAVQPC